MAEKEFLKSLLIESDIIYRLFPRVNWICWYWIGGPRILQARHEGVLPPTPVFFGLIGGR